MSIIGRTDAGGQRESCGGFPTVEGHDHCIGTIQNIMNACCGHGTRNEPYIQFWSFEDALSVVFVDSNDIDEVNCIRGEKAEKYISENSPKQKPRQG